MQGREKRPLGALFGLTNFGVNLTTLASGAVSALRHAQTTQDEFIYILEGHATLHTDEGRSRLSPCMCGASRRVRVTDTGCWKWGAEALVTR